MILLSTKSRFRIFQSTIINIFFLGAIVFCISGSSFAQDDDIISVDSSVVVLNATITDSDGNPAYGLKKEDFEIYEDGKRQDIAFFETQETPFAAVILIDTSGSMEARVSLARSAAIKFLDGIRVDDNVAIYNFDSKVSLVQDFSNLRDLTHRAFDLKANGWTVLNDAIFEASKVLAKRDDKRRAIVVLSDGADTRSGRSADKALKEALSIDATIYTVDMSSMNTGGKERMQNQGALKKFAEKTGGRFIKTPGGVEMRNAFEQIADELGTQYTLGYYPSNLATKDGKWHEIELRTAKKQLDIRTRKGYNSPKQ